jgi:hypothetical protein
MPTSLRLKTFLVVALAGLAVLSQQPPAQADSAQTVSFNRDIRPIFSDTCFRCHGPDKNARKAGLRLDIREEALQKTKSGSTPIVPGKPGESEIIRRIFAADKYEVMPPPDIHKELTSAQKDLLKRWVAEGAPYEGHWAYQPITRPVPLQVASSSIRNPIDAFIQTRLAQANLQPAPEADRRTLIRRVALDLTGIPPTPQEVAAFVNDKAANAYENLVDRLLNSDRYAEKQAMHWLDAVRYADTAGFHGDNAFPTWPYRDYVLRAFRNNKPFDEFTREQLAGDLLPNATTETRIASAYNRINRVSAEGGVQPKEYLAKYAADRVRTTSIVWLGATMGCAECHDHKFDPFLAKDFYSMKAFFADIKETGLVADRGRNAWGSKMMLPSPAQERRLDELNRELEWLNTELERRAEELRARQSVWEQATLAAHQAGELEWKFQRPLSAKAANGSTLKVYNDEQLTHTQYRGGSVIVETITGDGLVVASGALPEREVYTVTFKPGAGEWTALGVEAVQEENLPASRFARGADRFVLNEIEAESHDAGKTQKLHFALATTDRFGEQLENHPYYAIDGDPQTGWGISYGDGRNGFIALRLAQPLRTTKDTVITVRLRQESDVRKALLGRFRVALSSATHSWPDHTFKAPRPWRGLPQEVALALSMKAETRGNLPKKTIFDHFKWAAPELQELNSRRAQLEAARDRLDAEIPRVVVAEATSPMETRLLPRGNFLDESGEVLQPAIPAVFGKLDNGMRRANRLDLANWLVAKSNPLTARVFVNRIWRQFFGVGLSKVMEDLGSQGEWPVHPELLDWLASEFMHPASACGLGVADCGLKNSASVHDWDVKHLIRLIVTSHTYRQTSTPPATNPPAARPNPPADDPDNRLLSHQNRFRVEAEIVRDIALSAAGLLVEKFGGPSVKPYQPDGYLGALNFPKRDYAADRGDALYRRGLYIHWQRTFLHPSLTTFDAPSREECTVNRVSSNTPLQALELLNDPIYVEAARVFAAHALKQGGATPAAQIGWAFERGLGRPASLAERRVLLDLYRKNLSQFQRDAQAAQALLSVGDATVLKNLPAARLAAMTTVTRAILNLHETITRN